MDGYVSETTNGFSTDGFYVDEFELKMFGIPISESGEVLNDIQAGAACGTTELAVDTTGFAAYGLLDDFGNLIFRFRLAGDRPSVEAYTVLVDTDGLFGDADPNQTPNNPGFELDITLIKNQRVSVFNLDGQDGCPAEVLTYDIDTHYQKSIAGTESCDDADFFYDFYVPLGDLITEFNIDLDTEMQFFAVTNVSATCALGGKISDVGGVDDTEFDGCNVCAFTTLSESQCPTALNDLCSDCGGFSLGATPRPEINAPLKVGETEITGTAEPGADIFLDIYDAADILIDQDTTLVDGNGDWLAMLANPLAIQDSVTARAQIEPGCTSGISESDLSFEIVVLNEPPVLTGSGTILDYTENDGPVSIDNNIIVADIDDTEIDGAVVTVVQNYTPAEDLIVFNDQSGITGSFDSGTATLTLTGKATLAEYTVALASITYENSSEDPDTSPRQVSFVVNDGLDDSNIIVRVINVISVNDPPVFLDPSLFPTDTLTFDTDEDVTFEICVDVADPDNGPVELVDAQSLSGNSTLNISVIDPLCFDFIPDPDFNGVDYSRIIGCDQANPALCDTLIVKVNVNPINDPPQILIGGLPLDTLSITTPEDTPIDECLTVTDVDGNALDLTFGTSITGNGTFDPNPTGDLCFNFSPDTDYNGLEYGKVAVKDNGVPSLTDTIVVEIDITPVNDPPVITGSAIPLLYTNGDGSVVIDNTINITDVDDSNIESATVTITNNYVVAEDFLNFVDQNGITGSFAGATGILSLTGTTTLANYTTALASVEYEKTGVSSIKTRRATFVVFDGTDNSTGFVSFIDISGVNQAPVIVDDGNDTIFVSTNEDTLIDICLVVNDPDDDLLAIDNVISNTNNGVVDVSNPNLLCFSFIPDADFNGLEILVVNVCDQITVDSKCDNVVIVIDVLPVNDPPVILVGGVPADTISVTTPEDTPIDVCLDVADIDSNNLDLNSGSSLTGNGTFDVNPTGDLCFNFIPNPDFSGVEIGKVFVCDDGIPSLCDSIIVVVDVTPVNDPPVFLDPSLNLVDTLFFSTDEDVSLDICIDANDIDNGPVEIASAISLSGNASLSLSLTDALCYTFIPNLDFNGRDISRVIGCDQGNPALCDTVIVVVDVLPINDPPEILLNGQPIDTLNISTLEDTPVETCLDAADVDGDNLDVTYGTSITGNGIFDVNPLGDLCFNFIPNLNFNGQELGLVAVCDNGVPSLCDTVVVVADVIPVNDPPVLLDPSLNLVDTLYFTTNEDTNFGICIDADDPDVEDVEIIDALSLTGNASINLSISNALCYTFMPNLNFNGREITRIIGCDQGNPALCDTIFVVVDILPINDPPVISTDTLNLVTDEDIPINFCLDVNDPDNPTLELADLISTGNGIFSSSSSNPFCFDFVPNENFNGSDLATISICDGESPTLCDTVIVVIDVLPVNDPPVAIDDTIRLLRNRSSTKDLLANDSDIDGDNLTIDQTLESPPLHGSVVINLDGTVTYTPSLAFFGEDSFSYQVCDDGNPSLCSAANVLIEVENVDLVVYQAVSPNGDGINDFWEIKEIGFFGNNLVRLFDRYNNIIFEMPGYNNDDRVWIGQTNEGLAKSEAPDGTYYYIINLGDGSKILSGFVVLKRE